jgi:hypothetical protein
VQRRRPNPRVRRAAQQEPDRHDDGPLSGRSESTGRYANHATSTAHDARTAPPVAARRIRRWGPDGVSRVERDGPAAATLSLTSLDGVELAYPLQVGVPPEDVNAGGDPAGGVGPRVPYRAC